MNRFRIRRWRPVAVVVALTLLAAACGNGDVADPIAENGAGNGDVDAGGEPGTLVILHAMTGDTDDTRGLRATLERFTEETGVQTQDTGSADFEQLALTRVQGGNPPDIILHPQPGLMYDLIEQGVAFPQDDVVDVDRLRDEMVEGLFDIGVVDGDFYGIMTRLNTKSLVWYVPEEFEAGGYEVPETWEAMMDLSEQMIADGRTPWCIGIEASAATGWVATDWIEDIMLRVHGGDVYDQWIEHGIPFDSPEVREAIEGYFDPIFFGEGMVFGGTPNILQTSFGDSVLGLFDGSCMMHRQAGFIEGFMPDDVEYGEGYDFFYLPEIEATGVGAPVLVASDYAVAYTENPDVATFFEYFATPESGEPWAAEGSWVSPFVDFDTSLYAEPSLEAQGEIVANADFARFDASDMMPGAVGTGSFWTEMVNYIQRGGEDLDTALSNIDAAWPN